MQSHVKRRKYKSYKSGLLLLGLLVISWVLITGINKSGIPAGLASLINADYENFRNLERFDSLKAQEVRSTVAGFWTYVSGDPQNSPVVKREYLDLLENGMVWTVREWDLRTLSGETHTLTHVIMGFLSPYSYSPDKGGYFCETRIIRQVYVYDGDTCYGASQVDEIWEAGLAAGGDEKTKTLTMNRREYQPYTGELSKFFPDNSLLDIVDNISLTACRTVVDLPWVSKKLLARSMDAVPFFNRAATVESLIQSYYKPIVLDELARRYDPRAVPDVMDVKMTISPEGEVTDLKYRGAKVVSKRFTDLAVPEMKSWLYPAVGDSNDPQTLEIKVRVK